MGTQTTIAHQIRQQQADYILALKGNQATLLRQAQAWFEQVQAQPDVCQEYTQHPHTRSGHHRVETRQVWQVPAQHVFTPAQCLKWSGLKSLVVVHSRRRLWNKDTVDVRYFLSSLETDAAAFVGYIRAHWGTENQLHGCLDVVFGEDASRIRKDHAPRNVTLLRRLALNLLRQEPSKGSLAMKRCRAGLDNQFLLQVLTSAFDNHPAQPDSNF